MSSFLYGSICLYIHIYILYIVYYTQIGIAEKKTSLECPDKDDGYRAFDTELLLFWNCLCRIMVKVGT